MPTIEERVRGCLLGGAVGDALGAPVEFASLDSILRAFGGHGIEDFAEAYGRIGAITDDTQMTLFTAEGLLWAAAQAQDAPTADPVLAVYAAYRRWLRTQGRRPAGDDGDSLDWGLFEVAALHSPRGPGNTCLAALSSGRMGTVDDHINHSKGCGGIMRVAPVGLIGTADPFRLGCETAAITHGHPTGYLAAGCMARLIHDIAAGQDLRTATVRASHDLATWPGSEECVRALQTAMGLAERNQRSPSALTTLGEGWVAEEALAIGLYCAWVSDDFASGVRLAVNHSGDSDSTGSITGNILGALLGEQAIPQTWVERVEVRDVIIRMADDILGRFWHSVVPREMT